MVVATVFGEALNELPKDLYVPPDALDVLLETFSGPLDLLLYLIRKNNLNILDIPILLILEQYLQYIQFMEAHRLPLAAQYLAMAAHLAEIKSKLLLPKASKEETMEEDPRAYLIQQLLIYEAFKKAAVELDQRPRWEREHWLITLSAPEKSSFTPPEVALETLQSCMQNLRHKQQFEEHHEIEFETLRVEERMAFVLSALSYTPILEMTEVLKRAEGRSGLVITLLAVLELMRQSLINVMQHHPYETIYLKRI